MKVLTAKYGSPDAPEVFTRSLRETGFGVLSNHPIAPSLVSDTFNDWSNFFKDEAKFKYTFDPVKQEGYFPFRTENAKNYGIKDLKEFYHFYNWSKLPEGMKTNTRKLFDSMSDLARELLSWIEEYTPADIRKKFSMPLPKMIDNSRETLLRPIHYPPLSGTEEQGAIRAAAHEDINLITLLPAATAPGLQVMDTAGNWYDVPCDPGSIVINTGDMLQMASQGFYRSTTHRVMNPTGPESKKPRFSMPLFLHPESNVHLSETVTAGAYLRERLEEIGLVKK